MPLCRWSQALWRARRCLELAQPRVVEEILPGARLPFAWEQVTARPALDLHVGGATCRALRIDELTLSSSVEVPGPDGRTVEVLRYRTLADGPVRVLQVLSLRDSSLLAAVPHAPSLSSLGSFVGSDDSRPRLKLSIGLNAVGLALISRGAHELLYASGQGINISYTRSTGRATLALKVRHVQVDNQGARPLQGVDGSPASVFPVLLRPLWSEAERQQPSPPPALQLLVRRNLEQEGGRLELARPRARVKSSTENPTSQSSYSRPWPSTRRSRCGFRHLS